MTASLDFSPLFYWVRERDKIRWCKESNLPMDNSAGGVPFWTDDPILRTYRFCNVRREDDRGTVWIRKNIREPYAGHPFLWLMLCIARQINWPQTLAELIKFKRWPLDEAFDPQGMTELLNARKCANEKIYTGAYMISAPSTKGADKQAYIAETVLGALWRRRESFRHLWIGRVDGFGGDRTPTLQRVHAWLTQSNGWGQFMAYQAVVDMRFTDLLVGADDVASWAAAGPGTLRGLNRIFGRPTDASLSQDRALTEMRAIYKVVQQETGVTMDFSDVPNILCETDKYLRVRNGEGKPRALYVPGRGRRRVISGWRSQRYLTPRLPHDLADRHPAGICCDLRSGVCRQHRRDARPCGFRPYRRARPETARMIEDALRRELDEAERKAWDALGRYKFQMFGYWAAIWVHLNRIGAFRRPNPWKRLVQDARR